MFKRVYVTEKIHGTSAHISFNGNTISFFSGGSRHDQFIKLFDQEKLIQIYKESSFLGRKLTIFGEACGGNIQKMSTTYGKDLTFIAFEVEYDDKWFNVPDAESVAKRFGLDFVWYKLVDNTLENLNKYRDQPSELAKLKGCGDDRPSEGIVIRPRWECYDNKDGRWIVKHKNEKFSELGSPRLVDPNKAQERFQGQAVAEEFVTPMRLAHVLDKHPEFTSLQETKSVIAAVMEDLKEECEDEIEWSRCVEKAISGKVVYFYKEFLHAKFLEAAK